MRSTRAGEVPDDLDAFCRAVWPRLVGALSLQVGGRELAEELAQEAVARTCRHWETVRTLDSPAGWVHRVAFNLANSHHRRLRAARRAHRLVRAEAPTPDPADVLAVRAAVAELPPHERSVVVCRYYLGLSVAETADALGCPEATVKTRTRRALARLRATGIIGEDS